MGDKNEYMAEPNTGLYRALSLAAIASAKRQRRPLARQLLRNSFRGTQIVTAFASLPNVAET